MIKVLRLYKPIEHKIFELHNMLEHLVCSVWCEASDDACDTKIEKRLNKLLPYSVKKGITFKDEIENIYEIFKIIDPNDKDLIKEAFTQNNEIEKLCNKDIVPVYLSTIHPAVAKKIQDLFKWCYEDLLNTSKVAGDKLDYYKALIEFNNFHFCPCCGLIDFESPGPKNKTREANDHYLPKSKYPFLSVNFQNLVPLCYKCNSDRKNIKNPIENERKAYYPFANEEHEISIVLKIDKTKDIDKLERDDLTLTITGEADKIETWDWLFDISDRYKDAIREKIAYTLVRQLANRYKRSKKRKQGLSFTQIIDDHIQDYEDDKYSDKKFSKIAFLEELKNRKDIMALYDDP